MEQWDGEDGYRKVSDPCSLPVELERRSADGAGSRLQRAVVDGDEEGVLVLLRKGTEVDWQDEGGKSALHFAARSGSAAMCKLLLEHGADPNLCTHKGYTALHVAAWSGSLPCVTLLQEAGCDATARVSVRFLSSRRVSDQSRSP